MDDGTDEMTDERMESRVCTPLFSPPRRSKQTMTGRMDTGMTGRMTGRTDSGQASFLIPTSFTICNNGCFYYLSTNNLFVGLLVGRKFKKALS
jgi:hypothetical protein